MKIIFSGKCLEYRADFSPEMPERVSAPLKYLSAKKFQFIEPEPCTEEDLQLCHTSRLIESVKTGNFYDEETPPLECIFEYAKLAVGAAIKAALLSLEREKTFSLMRPPGHHAEKDRLGGFCYFNNIAVAAMKLLQKNKKVAIIDIDCHHGNGTEDIVSGNKNILYVSLHQSPLYPGTGLVSKGNCLNYPLSTGTDEKKYLAVLKRALSEVKNFKPNVIAVSAGFDTYKGDPLAGILLETESYEKIGQMIAGLNKPVFCVLEGGYSPALPECIYKFLSGLEHPAKV